MPKRKLSGKRSHPEGALQKVILDYLRILKIPVWKINTVGVYVQARNTYIPSPNKGISDIIGILPDGKFLAIEVKIKPNKPSTEQLAFLETVTKSGGRAGVVYSLKDVQQLLLAYGYRISGH